MAGDQKWARTLCRYRWQRAAAIGIDTWGVDYALLDSTGRLLGNPVHYRDARCNGVQERLFGVVPPEKIFGETGIQFMQINTLIQLYAMRDQGDPQLDQAATLLMIPDLFNYWMTGRKAVEYTIASTTQMLHAAERRWATGLLAKLGLPTQILPEIVPPGTSLGNLLASVCDETGIKGAPPVIAPGTHDTASAVAAIPGLDERSVYISSGTWSLMGVEIAQPILNDATRRLNFTNEGGVANTIRLLKNIGGLWLLQESRRQWARSGHDYSWEALMAEAEKATPFRSIIDPDAPDFMAPGQMVDAIVAYCRRTGQPAPESVGQVVRCALESLALRYRWTMGALEELVGHKLETRAYCRRWLPKPAALPINCRCLSASCGDRPSRGHCTRQCHGASNGNGTPGQSCPSTRSRRCVHSPRAFYPWPRCWLG